VLKQPEVAEFGRNRAGQFVAEQVENPKVLEVAQFRRNYISNSKLRYDNNLHRIPLRMYHLRYTEMSGISCDSIGSQRTQQFGQAGARVAVDCPFKAAIGVLENTQRPS